MSFIPILFSTSLHLLHHLQCRSYLLAASFSESIISSLKILLLLLLFVLCGLSSPEDANRGGKKGDEDEKDNMMRRDKKTKQMGYGLGLCVTSCDWSLFSSSSGLILFSQHSMLQLPFQDSFLRTFLHLHTKAAPNKRQQTRV